MYPFLQDFEQVSVKAIRNALRIDKDSAEIPGYLYCLNEDDQLTHLLIRVGLDLSFLSQLLSIESLTTLIIQNCQLTEVPDIVCQLIQLEELDLDYNNISQLPEMICQLNQLKYLALNSNKITQLHVSLTQLNQLNVLEFNGNQLKALPESFGKLSHLRTLHMDGNQLTALPETFGELSHLRTLHMDGNQLTALPETFGELSHLRMLHMDGNQLIALPATFGKLSQLLFLYLSNNQLTTLPPTINQLDKLVTFDISKNSITNNVHEIALRLPISESIIYLLEIQKPKTKILNEAKVLVVGDERVGKTSIINRIIGREMDEEEKSTLGIDIQQFPLSNGISINIWDFAGQEITHQTHQFFLSHRSLYLYVLDAQKEDNDSGITQWLDTIKATAGDSPIIIVINKCDLNPSYQFDTYRYQQDYNIVKVLYTSAQDEAKIKVDILPQINDSIECLVNVVAQQIEQIKEVKLPFPPSWLAVKQALEDEQKKDTDFIESAQYEDICNSNDLTNPSLQDALLSVLNQIGTIVTYKEHNRLNVMQIINPAWVTNGVYKILRSPLINPSQATLNEQQFRQIFANDKKYEKQRHYRWLIDLLKQFRLAFSIDENTVLIPSRLEGTQPKIDMADYQQGLHFLFEYEGILKKGILSQFIVAMAEYITTADEKYWQRGVFLQYDTANAVVISNEEKKTITIAINQANRAGKELLTIIRHSIRRINGPDLKYDEQVPLLKDGERYGFESYDAILDAEQEGEGTIRCRVNKGDKKFLTFNVSDLLDGYRIKDDTLFDYRKLEDDLFNISCLETENRKAIFDENEDLTNDRFKTALLGRGYKVSDQSRGGESGTRLSAGERDLLIRNEQTGVTECLIEAFVLKTHDASVISSHIEKLIHNYDTVGNKNNYAISYVKSARFFELWEKYQLQLPDFEDNTDKKGKDFVRVGRSIHGSGKFKRVVTHLFINFFPGEQEQRN